MGDNSKPSESDLSGSPGRKKDFQLREITHNRVRVTYLVHQVWTRILN